MVNEVIEVQKYSCIEPMCEKSCFMLFCVAQFILLFLFCAHYTSIGFKIALLNF